MAKVNKLVAPPAPKPAVADALAPDATKSAIPVGNGDRPDGARAYPDPNIRNPIADLNPKPLSLPGTGPAAPRPDAAPRPQMAHNPQNHLLSFKDVTKEGEPCVTMSFDREVRLKLDKDDNFVTVRATPGLHEVPERLAGHWYLKVNQVQEYRK